MVAVNFGSAPVVNVTNTYEYILLDRCLEHHITAVLLFPDC